MFERLSASLALAILAVACGGASPVQPNPINVVPTPIPVPPEPAPTSWPISGLVTAGPAGTGIDGATLTFGTLAPVTTSAGGRYTIVTTDSSTQPLRITAPGYLTRETYLRGGLLRSLDIDLISPDMLTIWQAMAHNGSESPAQIANVPTQRWTTNPNIYIWTTWKDTGLPVANVDWWVREIRRVIPQLSGFTLQAGVIETGPDQRPPAPGWINIQFHHSGNYGYLGKNPGEVQFAGDSACNYIAVTHEIGHAMGYWHTGMFNTIMGSTPGYCHEADLTPNELRVAKAMYSRAPYNYTPDRESNSSSPLDARLREGVKITCDRVIARY